MVRMFYCRQGIRGSIRHVTDCCAGGFTARLVRWGKSSARKYGWTGRRFKYQGLSYTEIWISEAQERMVMAVPPACLDRLKQLCHNEDVEVAVLGQFVPTGLLRLTYEGIEVGCLSIGLLHGGRPPCTASGLPASARSALRVRKLDRATLNHAVQDPGASDGSSNTGSSTIRS